MLPCSGKNRLLEEPNCRVYPATPLFIYMMSHAHHESWLRKCWLFGFILFFFELMSNNSTGKTVEKIQQMVEKEMVECLPEIV